MREACDDEGSYMSCMSRHLSHIRLLTAEFSSHGADSGCVFDAAAHASVTGACALHDGKVVGSWGLGSDFRLRVIEENGLQASVVWKYRAHALGECV